MAKILEPILFLAYLFTYGSIHLYILWHQARVFFILSLSRDGVGALVCGSARLTHSTPHVVPD